MHRKIDGSPEMWAEAIARTLRRTFDQKAATLLFISRLDTFRDDDRALVVERFQRVGQVCIAIRNPDGAKDSKSFHIASVRAQIESALREFEGRVLAVAMPNVTRVSHNGRALEFTPHPSTNLAQSAHFQRTASLATDPFLQGCIDSGSP
jgi:hypothetical protein